MSVDGNGKLVRDRIPELIRRNGGQRRTRRLSDEDSHDPRGRRPHAGFMNHGRAAVVVVSLVREDIAAEVPLIQVVPNERHPGRVLRLDDTLRDPSGCARTP